MSSSSLVWCVATLLGLLQATLAAPSANATAACAVLQRNYPQQVADSGVELSNLTLGPDYTQATSEYWSQANHDIVPACVFFPASAQDVAFAVQVLNNYTDVPWAVKGGGHNPNPGYSATAGGILLSMEQNWATTRLDSNNLAHVGPGNRWVDVATALDPYNRAVVSGRLGHVGAAGLTLGGGLSFLSTEYGMTADTVVYFEVVTAAGQIINASSTENSDIWYGLKGGGGQFGIVTDFVLQTYPIGKVWGGYKIFTLDKKAALLNATHNLVSDYYDPKAAVIMTFSTTLLSLVDIFVVFFFYNDPNGPGDILAEFNAIDALVDQTSAGRSYLDVINSNSLFSIDGMRYLIRTGTYPSLPGANGTDLYNYIFDDWYALAKDYETSTLDNFVFSLAYQPVPHTLANASVNSPTGVNLLGLDPAYGDKFFMEYDVSWLLANTDAAAATFLTNITQGAQDYATSKYSDVPPTNYQSGDLSWANFNPKFMNDAMYNQDPLRSYGDETYNKLAAIQKQVDPDGFFSRRTGGFKYT